MHLLFLHLKELSKGTDSNLTNTSGADSSHTVNGKGDNLENKFLDYGIDYAVGTVLGTNVGVQALTVPEPMFKKVRVFYCCASCGKVFWEGSHFEKVCEQYSHVLNLDESGPSVYDKLNSGS